MKISTKGRYALRVMIDLAQNNSGEFVPLKDIAERQGISRKYLESIVVVLSKAGFLTALHGKGGGYKLKKEPNEYTVGSVLKLIEGSLAPVSCLECDENTCERAGECKTLPMWTELYKIIDNYFESISIADLSLGNTGGSYII